MGVGETVGKALLGPFVDRFVAGETPRDALETVESLNAQGIGGIVSSLGEHVQTEEAAKAGLEEYVEVLDLMAKADVDGCISVKPTHMGLEIGPDVARENLLRIAEHARQVGTFVWVDMERSTFTDATLDLYEAMLDVHGDVGICLQSALKRTSDDLDRVLDRDGVVRLVKGAYKEPAEIAYVSKDRIDGAFAHLMRRLFDAEARFAVATHDPRLIELAETLDGAHDATWEFQMLLGVRDDAKPGLVERGHRLQVYIPYGPAWFPYYWRRIQERRENLWFALRAALGGR